MRIDLKPRLWLAAFTVTSLFYLAQTDAERIAIGRWPSLSPWLHTSALPVFAVLAVVMALLWAAVQRWLSGRPRLDKPALPTGRGSMTIADLRGATLDEAALTGARADANTTWPAGFDAERRRELGVIETDDGGAGPISSP